MKVLRAEKIWLAICLLGYIFYNLPGFPAYGDMRMCIIHGIISLIWVWGGNYIGVAVINRIYQLRDSEEVEGIS